MYEGQCSNSPDFNIPLRDLQLTWFGDIMVKWEGAGQESVQISNPTVIGIHCGTLSKSLNLCSRP